MTRHILSFPAKPGPISLDQITDADRHCLRHLAKTAKLVIDVGTFLGASAEALLEGMDEGGMLVSIDTFCGTPGAATAKLSQENMLAYALGRLARFADRLTIMVGENRQISTIFARQSADLVFLDAAHDYENVKADIAAWLPVVKPDGLIAGHDVEKSAGEHLNWNDVVERSDVEWDKGSGVHCGVVRAIYEAFNTVNLAQHPASSVWTAKPEWARRETA